MAKKSARKVHKRDGLEKLISDHPQTVIWLVLMLLGLLVGYKILAEGQQDNSAMYIPIALTVVGAVGFFGSTVSAFSKHRK